MKYSIWGIKGKFDTTYSIQLDKNLLEGDLLLINGEYFLIKDKIGQGKEIDIDNYKILGNLLQPRTIFFINFISNYWYSYFFKFFHFYVPEYKYLEKFDLPIVKKKYKMDFNSEYICEYKNFDTYYDYLKLGDNSIQIVDYDFVLNFSTGKGQNLFIFPDLWALSCFEEKISFKYDILNINSTSLQRMKKFFEIKNGKINNILTTHAGVFQDWKNLENIFVFYPYKWYYKNQQNPRYYLPEIAKQIKFFYQVKNLFYVV